MLLSSVVRTLTMLLFFMISMEGLHLREGFGDSLSPYDLKIHDLYENVIMVIEEW